MHLDLESLALKQILSTLFTNMFHGSTNSFVAKKKRYLLATVAN